MMQYRHRNVRSNDIRRTGPCELTFVTLERRIIGPQEFQFNVGCHFPVPKFRLAAMPQPRRVTGVPLESTPAICRSAVVREILTVVWGLEGVVHPCPRTTVALCP